MTYEQRLAPELLVSLNHWGRSADIEKAPINFERITRAQGGASSEAYFVTARSTSRDTVFEWVLRVEPIGHQVYQDASIARPFATISRLAREPGLPIPHPVVLETDASVIGAPFFLMERARRDVPPNNYHREGLLVNPDPGQRRVLWHESIILLAASMRSIRPTLPFSPLRILHPTPRASHRSCWVGQLSGVVCGPGAAGLRA